MKIKSLVKEFGGRFSTALGINLSTEDRNEIFKWFFASILFGARISETIVIHTYREFEKKGVLSPEAILRTGWDGLVAILDKGGYVRHDFKTATKLLNVSRRLVDEYKGSLNTLHAAASDAKNLEDRLKALGKGIGDVTVNIFLREMRGVWPKAEPLPSDLVISAARDMNFIPKNVHDKKKILDLLKKKWTDQGMRMKDFPDYEAALIRIGRSARKKAA